MTNCVMLEYQPNSSEIEDGHTFQTPEARHTLAPETLAFFSRYLVADP